MGAYFGSKATSGLCQAIIALMPPHSTYIETHLGGGAIMKRKPPAQKNIGIDLDSKALSEFSCDYPVDLIHQNAHEFLSRYNYTGHEFIYCDPPYLLATRSSKRRYRYDYTDGDHIKLLEILDSLPCKVILSGYPSDLYNEMLPTWSTKTIQVMNQAGVRTEKIWYNYDISQPFWSSYAGKNFTDRQRVKRKAQRWAKNYKSLPKAEQLTILSAIMCASQDEQDTSA